MRRTIALLATMALTLLVASGVALAAVVGSAGADSSVVGPGESIQKAINAADPGDTIVVKGVHREDVVIRKDGIKLRGDDDAVIEAPPKAKADSPCSKTFGPEAICILGDVNISNGELTGPRVSDVSVSGFTIRGFEIGGKDENKAYAIDVFGARDATITQNRVVGNVTGGIGVGRSIDTTIANNQIIGNPKTEAEGIRASDGSRNTKMVNNEVRNIPFPQTALEANEAIGTTMVGNDLENNWIGPIAFYSPGTRIVSNVVSGSGFIGALVLGQKSANVKIVGNHISGGPWGIFVTDARGGSIAGNQVHDNCAGMFFVAFPSQPVGDFKVKANTVEHNTRSCRAAQFDRNFSGIGIALLGASGIEVTGNNPSGNVPSGPTAVSGGIVVATDPFFGETIKPKNNSVTGNAFGRNKPDIYWDESGTGNSFVGNLCNTSVPSSLCN